MSFYRKSIIYFSCRGIFARYIIMLIRIPIHKFRTNIILPLWQIILVALYETDVRSTACHTGTMGWPPNPKALMVIPAIVLKTCAPELAPILDKLFQLSYTLGTFPTSWKLAHVFPIPKKVASVILSTIVQLQSFHSSLKQWRPSPLNNFLPSLKQTIFFLITSVAFEKPGLLVFFLLMLSMSGPLLYNPVVRAE